GWRTPQLEGIWVQSTRRAVSGAALRTIATSRVFALASWSRVASLSLQIYCHPLIDPGTSALRSVVPSPLASIVPLAIFFHLTPVTDAPGASAKVTPLRFTDALCPALMTASLNVREPLKVQLVVAGAVAQHASKVAPSSIDKIKGELP